MGQNGCRDPMVPSGLFDRDFLRGANTGRGDVLDHVIALREEIAALREALVPVPSMILTGQEVLAEFQRIRNVTK
jgi:hypothetical protein